MSQTDVSATAFSDEDLIEIGHAVLSGVGTLAAFGWSMPSAIRDYVVRPDDWRRALVYDLMCAGGLGQVGDDARARLLRFAVEDTNLLDEIAAAVV